MDNIQEEARSFVAEYAALFSSPQCSSTDGIAQISSEVGKRYRPGITFFTNGQISRFESQEAAAALIAQEMRKNVKIGMGTYLELLGIEKVEVYSSTSALCWLRWKFHPQKGSEYEGRGWTFTNIYGYRAASDDAAAGWEFVVRDDEVNAMVKATGMSFTS